MTYGNGAQADPGTFSNSSNCFSGWDSHSALAANQKMTPSIFKGNSLTALLWGVFIVLVFAYSIKHGLLSLAWLGQHKDALSAANSVASMAAIAVGGVLAYYRFFKGRTLATRADLSITTKVLRSSEQELWHIVTLTVKNVGNVAIWEPRPLIDVTVHNRDGSTGGFQIDKWYEAGGGGQGQKVAVLDSGESSDFFTQQRFPITVWAVTYAATVRCASGDSWTKLSTFENTPPGGEEVTAT